MPNERPFLRDIHIGAQCTLMLLALSATTLLAQDPWARADLETRRLPPSMFRRLPTPVRADLERRGCTVPQIWADTVSANVVTGHFRTTAKTDWAVLCSVHRVSIILVYLGGTRGFRRRAWIHARQELLAGSGRRTNWFLSSDWQCRCPVHRPTLPAVWGAGTPAPRSRRDQ